MNAVDLRLEDKLEGASNFVPWKERVTLVLMENMLWEFSNTIMIPLIDPKDLIAHELKDMKSRRIILDEMKDHLIPRIFEKKSTRERCL
jgi:hypothetical protein